MWHVDGKYYPGLVQDILKTTTGWFYDVGYEGGDREFFLDLNVRKWKYAADDPKKTTTRNPPREKAKRVARKSTIGSSSYVPPPSSQPPLAPSTPDPHSAGEADQSTALRVETLLEVKERQQQHRTTVQQDTHKMKITHDSPEKQHPLKTLHSTVEQPIASQKPHSDADADTDADADADAEADASNALPPANVSPVATTSLKNLPPHLQSPFDIDLPELNEDAFDNVMADIDAPLSLGPTKKRLRAPVQTPETETHPKRHRDAHPLRVTPTVSLLDDEPHSSEAPVATAQPADVGQHPVPYSSSAQDRRLATIRSAPFSPPQPPSLQRRPLPSLPASVSQLPPNAAPPARKTVQQRSRSRSQITPKRKSQLLQSEPNFVPRPRPSSSRARSISRKPTSRRRASSPYHRADRRKLRSRASSPDYSFMRPSPYPASRAIESRKRTKTTVADIVSVSGHAAKKWLDENTKQFSANLKRMDAELAKMKGTHQKLAKARRASSKQVVKSTTPRAEETDMSDGERESVLHNMMNDFLRRVQKYKATVEEREQSLLRQFAGFKKTVSSQNGKLVSAGKVLAKLDIQGLDALENLQPVVRKKLEIPAPVPPRRAIEMNGTPPFESLPVRAGRPSAEDHRPSPTARQRPQKETKGQEKPSAAEQRSEAVVKTLRLKLADLVTRSDWLGEEVTRLKQREKALLREKREALTELTKVRSEKSTIVKGDAVSAPPRILPARSGTSRTMQRAPLNQAISKPVGTAKKTAASDIRADGRGGASESRRNLSSASSTYKARPIAPAPFGLGLRSRTPKIPPPPVPVASKPTPMEDVTRPKESERPGPEKEPSDIERGANFTDDLGKSMDKQASELLALIFTIWLLQDESRSEPPKQPGDKMDSWVRACVRNCLKHARTYLDATSGITTARRSLMLDVEGENIYTEWIIAETDSTFEQARSNYSLWDPTLQDVEWLAEKRVLVGLNICYRKAWKETSARQYETTLMYAKAIAHRAVSNFELYMPPTIVLRGPATAMPVAAKPIPQDVVTQGSTDKTTQQSTGAVTPSTDLASGPAAPATIAASQTAVPMSKPLLTSSTPTNQQAVVTLKGSIVTQPTSSGTSSKVRQDILPPVSSTIMKTGFATMINAAPKQNTNTAPAQEPSSKANTTDKASAPKSKGTDGLVHVVPPTTSGTPKSSVHSAVAHAPSQKQNEGGSDGCRAMPEDRQEQHQGDTEVPSSKTSQAHDFQKPEKSGKLPSSSAGKVSAPKPSLAMEKVPPRTGVSGNHAESDRQGSTTPPASSFMGMAKIAQGSQLPSKESAPKNQEAATSLGGGSNDVTTSPTLGQGAPVGGLSSQEAKRMDPASVLQTSKSSVQTYRSPTAPNAMSDSPSPVDRNKGQVPQGQQHPVAQDANVTTITNTASVSSPPKSSQPPSSATTGPPFPSSTFSSMRDSETGQAATSQQTRQTGPGLPAELQGRANELKSLGVSEKVTDSAVPAVQTSAGGNPNNMQAPEKNVHEPQARPQGPEHIMNTADASRETTRPLRDNQNPTSGDVSELPSLPSLSAPKSTSSTGKRGPKASISKSSGAKGKRQSKSSRGKTTGTGKSKSTRSSARVPEATGIAGSPRIPHRKQVTDQGPPNVGSSGMVGLMRLPGDPATTQHPASRPFESFSNQAAPPTTRQPIGMKRLPLPGAPKSIPPMPPRRTAPGAEPLDFESLSTPIPRRPASKTISDDVINPSQYGMEQQQGNQFSGTGRWGTQQPVPTRGYKSLTVMPSATHQSANVVMHSSNPFESRAVAPFEYHRPAEQGVPPEQRPELIQEGSYPVVEHGDALNPPTPAALSALEYGVEHVQRESLPNTTTEFQERFDRGYDPYRSQIGHIMNPAGRDAPGSGRNFHAKDYGRR